MRRKDREITDYAKMVSILEQCDCCRIGLIDDQGAYILPLNFGYEDIAGKLVLYFHSAKEGKKIDLLKLQSKASFELDRKHQLVTGDLACSYSFLFQSIMGNGDISFVCNEEEKIHGLTVLMSHYSKKKEFHFEKQYIDKIEVIKLVVTNWSCKEH